MIRQRITGRKGQAQDIALLTEEAAAFFEARRTTKDQLFEKWQRSKVGKKLDKLYQVNRNRARNVSLSLETEARHLKKLGEALVSTKFGTTPENVLRIVRIGTANSNRDRIFTEWPLVSTEDLIWFIDKVYEKNIRDGVIDARIYDTIAPNYPTDYNIESTTPATGNGSIVDFTITTDVNPVMVLSVHVLLGGTLIATDDGNGGFISVNNQLTGTNTVNYTTGAIVLKFATAPAQGIAVQVEYKWLTEDEGNFDKFGTLSLTLSKKRFKATPQPLGYRYSNMTTLTLESTGIGNPEDMLVRAVGDEHAKSRDHKAVQIAKRVALGNPIATFDADFASAGEDNDMHHAQRIMTRIKNVGGEIYNQIMRGEINRIIAAPDGEAYLSKHNKWEDDTTQKRVGGTYLAGRIGGVEVYVAPAAADKGLLADNELLLTYKNPDEEGDIGLAFGVLTEMHATLDYPEFYRVGNVATVEDYKVITREYMRILRIENLDKS